MKRWSEDWQRSPYRHCASQCFRDSQSRNNQMIAFGSFSRTLQGTSPVVSNLTIHPKVSQCPFIMSLVRRLFQRKRKGAKAAAENAGYYRHDEHAGGHHKEHHHQRESSGDSVPAMSRSIARSNPNTRAQVWRRDDEQRIHCLQSQEKHHRQPASVSMILSHSTSSSNGYNKTLRDSARVFLVAFSACMLYGSPYWALLWSALACLFLYHGKFWSVKNLMWGLLCWTSLPLALIAATLHRIQETILEMTHSESSSEEQIYSSTYIFFFSFERLLELSMGCFCAFILFLTFLGKVESEIN